MHNNRTRNHRGAFKRTHWRSHIALRKEGLCLLSSGPMFLVFLKPQIRASRDVKSDWKHNHQLFLPVGSGYSPRLRFQSHHIHPENRSGVCFRYRFRHRWSLPDPTDRISSFFRCFYTWFWFSPPSEIYLSRIGWIRFIQISICSAVVFWFSKCSRVRYEYNDCVCSCEKLCCSNMQLCPKTKKRDVLVGLDCVCPRKLPARRIPLCPLLIVSAIRHFRLWFRRRQILREFLLYGMSINDDRRQCGVGLGWSLWFEFRQQKTDWK